MTERLVGVTDQASGAGVADIRVRERTVAGSTVGEQYIIAQDEKVPSFRGMAASFRTVGSTATPQWVWQMQNATGTAVLVAVKSVVVMMDATAANTALNPIFGLNRSTGTRGGGTALSKVSVGLGPDAAQTSDANVTHSGASSADGTNTLITGLTAGSWMHRRLGNRLHTAAGQVVTPPLELVPQVLQRDGIILRSTEQLAVTLTTALAADNVVTNHYTVSVLWDEYLLP